MFIRNNQAFHTANHHDGISPMSFDRHLVANLLVSVYSGVLKEPLPDRLERLFMSSRFVMGHGSPSSPPRLSGSTSTLADGGSVARDTTIRDVFENSTR